MRNTYVMKRITDVYQERYSFQPITRCISDVVNVYAPQLIFTLRSKSINNHRNVSQQETD